MRPAPGRAFSPLVTRWQDNGRPVLTRPFSYSTRRGALIQLPPGFDSDAESIPWAFRVFLFAVLEGGEAGFLHDFLYRHGGYWLPWVPLVPVGAVQIDGRAAAVFAGAGRDPALGFVPVTRPQADDLFREALEDDGHPGAAPVAWAGVRIGGRCAYRGEVWRDFT